MCIIADVIVHGYCTFYTLGVLLKWNVPYFIILALLTYQFENIVEKLLVKKVVRKVFQKNKGLQI